MSDLHSPGSVRLLFEDLDAQGYGYWPQEAQDAISRRDKRLKDALTYIDRYLEEQDERYLMDAKRILRGES